MSLLNLARMATALACIVGMGSHAWCAQRRPNVLFVMVDEMRWDAMGCAGNKIVKTPNLDRLAAQGTRFATAYTVAPICTPSRYSFFTSRYAHVHGSVDNGTAPTEPLILLPSLLKHHGYQTAISGKLHFIPNDRDYDFESFWSFANEGPHKLQTWPQYIASKYQAPIQRRLEIQPFPDDPLGKDLGKLRYPREDHQSDWITDRAIEFLQKRDEDKPFFLFVSYLDPHSPSHLTEPYWSMYKPEQMPLPATFQQDPSKSGVTKSNRHEVNDPAVVRAMTAAYYAKMARVDDNLCRIFAAIDGSKLEGDTLIIFTADHGNMLGDLNRWFKGAMYEGSTRIPLILKAPESHPLAARMNRGGVIRQIVESIDVMPTLCEVIGVPLPPQGFQGRSLTPLLADKPPADWKNVAFSERNDRMVRNARYKLIQNQRKGNDSYELYDLEADPQETRNLASESEHARAMKQLSVDLAAWSKAHPAVPVIDGLAPLQPQPATNDGPRGKKRKAASTER